MNNSNKPGRVRDKVAIVTGTASNPGMGNAIARALAKERALVVCTDIDRDGAEACAKEIADNGGRAISACHDVSVLEDWERVVRESVREFGRIDVLVNNAGIAVLKLLNDLSPGDFDRQIAVNLTGPFLGTRCVVPEMRKSGGGSIVNVVSIAGRIGSDTGIAYGASKGGLWGMSKAVAIECAPDHIRCNTVHPGVIWTNMQAKAAGSTDPEDVSYVRAVPLGRMGEALDIANAVVYLASEESRYVTGAEIYVDGGITSQVGLNR